MPVPIGAEAADAEIRAQAEAWWARLQAPNAAAVAADFEQWRASDPRCAAAFASLDRKVARMDLLRFTATGRERDLARARGAGARIRAVPTRYKWVAAAILLVCVSATASLLYGAPAPRVAVAATRVGQIHTLRLVDGSWVTLDTDSQIVLRFSRRVRSVHLIRGRARFEVAHDTARPFIVEAAGRTITATGTIFDVALYGAQVRVSLLRGSVEVKPGVTGRTTHQPVARLRPGEMVQAYADRPLQEIATATRGADQWIGGMLSFDGAPLAEVLAQANRYSQVKIRLGTPDLAALKVTGAFRPVPLDRLAAGLSAAFGLRTETRPNGDIVLQRRAATRRADEAAQPPLR